MPLCLVCSKPAAKQASKYCSNTCQSRYEFEAYIKLWKAGKVSGGRGINTRNFSGHVRRYLLENAKACSLCGWDKTNANGKIPLEIDHIDGDSENNSEGNLRLICPNCHSLAPNYKNQNRGKGREWRRLKYVKNTA